MKKLILILTMIVGMGFLAQTQTDYSPVIASKTIAIEEGDTIHREVRMNITWWDNLKIQYQFVGKEYRNGVEVPYMTKKVKFNQIMDSTYTYFNPYPGGTEITNTGEYFVNAVYGGVINWNLVIQLGRNIYFLSIDPNGWFIKPE